LQRAGVLNTFTNLANSFMGLTTNSIRIKWLLVTWILVLGVCAVICFKFFWDRPESAIPPPYISSSYKYIPVSEKCLGVFYDFESESGPNTKKVKWEGQDSVTSVFAFSDAVEFGPTYSSKIKSICEFSKLSKLVVTCDALASRSDLPAPVVVSIELNGKSLYWKSMNLPFADAKWGPLKLEFNLPAESVDPEAELKVYIWNNSKHTFLIDNFGVGFFSGGGETQTYGYYPERFVQLDFESSPNMEIDQRTKNDSLLHKDGSFKLGFFQSFSPVISRRVGAVSDGPLHYIMARAEINPALDNPSVCFAVSLSDSIGNEYFFDTRANDREYAPGEWSALKAKIDLPHETIKSNDIISVYVWNRGFQSVLLDDFVVQFGESNKRVGRKPALDMQGYSDKGYDFKTNEPPFRKRTLEGFSVSKISNLPMAWTNEFDKHSISAFDKICVGKFGAGQSKSSQIFLFRNQHMFLFGFCIGDSSLRCFASTPISIIKGFDAERATFFSADINADGFDEVIAHQMGGDKIYVFRPDRNAAFPGCGISAKSTTSESIIVSVMPLENVIKSQYFKLITFGDFVGDGTPELLFTDNQTGNFNLYSTIGQLLSKGQSGSLKSDQPDELIIQAINFKSPNQKDYLAVRKNEISEFEYCCFDKSGSEIKNQKIKGSDLVFFTGCDDVMVSNTGNATIATNLYFHRTVPRFGFFEVSYASETGFEVLYEFDFNRFKASLNPKYYEKRKLLYGDFTGGGKLELLLISSNCSDGNFDGYNCQIPVVTGDFRPLFQIFKIN